MKGVIMVSFLVAAGAITATIGTVPYLFATIKGTVRPRLVSWVVWAVLAGIMTVSAYVAGQIPSALLSLCAFISCVAVTVLGWRQGRVGVSRLDLVCLVGAVLGILGLAVFKTPLAAIAIAVTVDIIAFIPTLVHAWQQPREESLVCFAMAAIGGGMALAAALLSSPALTGVLYPVYSVVFNGLAALIIASGRLGELYSYRYNQAREEA